MPSTKLGRFQVFYANSEEFHQLKREIFTADTYYFESESLYPVIIDAGAHLGLATLYFKQLYPQAKITAIEPHPENFKLLQKNVWENQLTDVEVIPAALSDQAGEKTFYYDSSPDKWWSTAGFHQGAWTGSQESQSIQVATLPLADLLTGPVDFLKLDIEGAEQSVLQAVGNQIRQIKQMYIEFHCVPEQSLPELVEWLERYGFAVQLHQDGKPVTRLDRATGLVHLEVHH